MTLDESVIRGRRPPPPPSAAPTGVVLDAASVLRDPAVGARPYGVALCEVLAGVVGQAEAFNARIVGRVTVKVVTADQVTYLVAKARVLW